jgi:hypothetical protein
VAFVGSRGYPTWQQADVVAGVVSTKARLTGLFPGSIQIDAG